MSEIKIDPELKKGLDEIQSEIKAELDKVKGQMEKVSEEKAADAIKEYKEKAGEYEQELDKKFAEMQGHLDELDKKSQELRTRQASNDSIRTQFKNFLKENIVDNANDIGQKGAQKNMEFKTVGDMSSGNITTAITNEYVQGQMEVGVGRVAKRPTFIQSLINTGTVSNSRTVSWYERTTSEGAVAARAEAATMAQVDYDWVRYDEALKFISGYTKVTNEALGDLSWLMTEIEYELFSDLELALDDAFLNADGTSNTIDGILNNASLFEAGNLLDSLPNGTPNNFDVLRATIKQIVLNYFFPTAIVVNPGDAAAMDIEKASDGHYILPPFSTPRGQTIKGVPVYENAGMAAGSFLVMDGSKATAYFREGISLRVWDQNENDPLFNRKTVTANVEALLRIKGVHTGAFVTGTFANAKLLLDASLSGSGS